MVSCTQYKKKKLTRLTRQALNLSHKKLYTFPPEIKRIETQLCRSERVHLNF